MGHNRNGHSVLVELMVVILFFSLSCVIILRLYSVAHKFVSISSVSTRILLQAQDWTDRICSASDVPSLLLNAGWSDNQSQMTLQVEGGLLVMSGLKEETGVNGDLFSGEMSAYAGNEKIFSYPVAYYHLSEVMP